jgi:hypothetical protein
MSSSTIECVCGKKFCAKKALDPEVKMNLQLRVHQHIEGTVDHPPLTWEDVCGLMITIENVASPPTTSILNSSGDRVPLSPPSDSECVQATQVGDAPPSDSECVQATRDLTRCPSYVPRFDSPSRLENLEHAVHLMCRGLTRLAEDIQDVRSSCRSRSRSRLGV